MSSEAESRNSGMPPRPNHKIHPFARATYPGRISILIFGAVMVAYVVWEQSPALGIGVVIFGLLYPHVMYLAALISGQSKQVGYVTFFTDTAVTGIWIVMMGYALVPSLAFASIVTAVPLLMGGVSLAIWAVLPMFAIIAIGLLVTEPTFMAHAEGLPLVLSGLMALSFIFYVSWQVNELGRSLIDARKSLEFQNATVSSQAALMESMNHMARLVNSTLDLGRVMTAIGESLSDVFEFDQQSILFLDREAGQLVLQRYIGTNAGELTSKLKNFGIPLKEQDSIFVATARNNRPYCISDVPASRDDMSPSDRQVFGVSPNKSLMTFPLSVNKQVIGVLAFSNTKSHFTLEEKDIAVIGRYVEFITSAVRNARMYERVKQARKAADSANQAKSQFLANMSHELRTPMNAVIGYSEMLMEDARDQGLEDFIPDLERICGASKHLLRLINDVLDLSKIEADKIELYPEVIEMDQLVDELKSTIMPLVESNGNELVVEREGPFDYIFTDSTKLRQAALNLLSNAAKFTHDGTVRLSLSHYFQDEQWWLDMAVSDTGIGMSEAQLKKVFDPFTQADASTTRKYGGTGLGLAISKRFCELMGGTIEAESREGEGSTFTIRIPSELNRQESAGSGERIEIDAGEARHSARILVIDDDPSAVDLMRRLLSRQGYEVISAESGAQGLELARRARPDVITLDALMPEMDGWSVLCELKDDPDLNTIPVVMVTFVDEPRKGFALGAAEYLTKPVDRAQLMNVIARLESAASKEALVVEDDQRTRELVAGWLQKEGWSVRSAVNGREGLEYFRSYRPSVVILDLMMPEVDGFEFLATLRGEFPDDPARIIVITAKELYPEDLRRLNGSVSRIIEKSQAPGEQLVHEIARHVPVSGSASDQ